MESARSKISDGTGRTDDNTSPTSHATSFLRSTSEDKRDPIGSDKNVEKEQLDDEEKRLASELRQLSEEGRSSRLGGKILQKMGDVYKRRGLLQGRAQNFVMASALYNAALMRYNESELKHQVEASMEQNERAFYKTISISKNEIPMGFRNEIKNKLHRIRKDITPTANQVLDKFAQELNLDAENRERVMVEKEFTKETRHVFGGLCTNLEEFHKDLLSRCQRILGPPPQEYAAIAMGSLARGDVTPYSDLEWAILVKDDEQDLEYFRNMVRLMHIFVLNIGETNLKTMNIKSLNDYFTPGENWFSDTVVARGVEFDSAAPFACKTPLGRPDRPERQGIELIKTPKHMAALCEYETAVKEGYIFDRVLTVTTKLDGDDHLFEMFRQLRAGNQDKEDSRKKYIQEIRDIVEEFLPQLSFHTEAGATHDIKKEMLRLPTVVIVLLKPLFSLNNDFIWDTIDEMISESILTSNGGHNLLVVISIVALLRLVMYCSKEKQHEVFVLFGKSISSESGNNAVVGYNKFKSLVVRYYYSLLPLVDFVRSDQLVDACTRRQIGDNFFERSQLTGGLIELSCFSYEDAREQFFAHIESLSTNPHKRTREDVIIQHKGKDVFCDHTNRTVLRCLYKIAQTYLVQDKFEEALKYSLHAIRLVQRKHLVKNRLKTHDHGLSRVMSVLNMIESLHEMNKRKLVYLRYADEEVRYTSLILDVIGNVCISICKYDMALQYFLDSLSMVRRLHSEGDHSMFASTLHSIGDVYKEMSKYDLALQYHQNVMGMMKRIHSDGDHPYIVRSIYAVGDVYKEMSKYELALQYYQDSLSMERRLYSGIDHPFIATSLHNIGDVYNEMCKYDLALQYFRDSMAMTKRIHGDGDHLDIATRLHYIGDVYKEMSKYDLALQNYQDSLSMKRRIHGDGDHPSIATTLHNIGDVYKEMIKYDLALQNYQDSLSMKRRVHGDGDHPSIATSLHNIGDVYKGMCKYNLALQYYQDSLSMKRMIHSDGDHPSIATSVHNIGDVYKEMSEHNLALQYYRESLGMTKRKHGDGDHTRIAITLQNIGVVYKKMNKYDLALQYYRDSLNMHRRIQCGGDHPDVACTLHNIADVYMKMSKYDLALQYYQDSLDMMSRVLGDGDHPYVALNLFGIANVYKEMSKFGLALRHYRDLLSIFRRTHGSDSPYIKIILINIGCVYIEMCKCNLS